MYFQFNNKSKLPEQQKFYNLKSLTKFIIHNLSSLEVFSLDSCSCHPNLCNKQSENYSRQNVSYLFPHKK